MEFNQINENSLLILLGNKIDLSLPKLIGFLTKSIKEKLKNNLIDITPSYTTILIEYNPLKITPGEIICMIKKIANCYDPTNINSNAKTISLPVYYDSEVAPDLLYLSEELALSKEEIIEIHSKNNYLVCAIGFAPGFGFLAEVDSKIRFPRKETPRAKVMAGSVGIANNQTAVYPADSPGGWQIIGNCPTLLFNPEDKSPLFFSIGDQIKFYPIEKKEYLSLGGKLETC